MARPKQLTTEVQAARDDEGLTNLVTRRLTSRQRPWILNVDAETYQMTWSDLGCYDLPAITRKVHELLGTVGVSDVEVVAAEDGVRISMPQGVYEAQLRNGLAVNQAMRVHEVGNGGRSR